MADKETNTASADRDDVMDRISARLSDSAAMTRMSTFDHALLRRMFLTNEAAAAGATVKLLIEAGLDTRTFELDWLAWKLVVHVAALLSGTARSRSHSRWRSLGTALHDAQLSEKRLLRLTAARGEALRDQVALAARLLAQADEGSPVNLWDVLHLVGQNAVNAETARLGIARDYYTAAAKAKKGDSK